MIREWEVGAYCESAGLMFDASCLVLSCLAAQPHLVLAASRQASKQASHACPTTVVLDSTHHHHASPTNTTHNSPVPHHQPARLLHNSTAHNPLASGSQTPTPAKMSSYLSNILTNTTNRYASLRRTLLSNEEDGDTEDDSHISRVLRAYYTEKARPFPPWLPPDPNDRRAHTPQPTPQQGYAQGQGYYTSAGGRSQFAPQAQGNRGSLNDLWDTPAPSAAPAAPQSLRAGRRLAPGGPRPDSTASLNVPPSARPLPSQRVGSYQSMQSTGSGRVDPSPPPSSGAGGGGGGTAQERLKARLWGGARAASPAGGASGNTSGGGGGNPYDQGYDGGGGGGGSARRFGRVT